MGTNATRRLIWLYTLWNSHVMGAQSATIYWCVVENHAKHYYEVFQQGLKPWVCLTELLPDNGWMFQIC